MAAIALAAAVAWWWTPGATPPAATGHAPASESTRALATSTANEPSERRTVRATSSTTPQDDARADATWAFFDGGLRCPVPLPDDVPFTVHVLFEHGPQSLSLPVHGTLRGGVARVTDDDWMTAALDAMDDESGSLLEDFAWVRAERLHLTWTFDGHVPQHTEMDVDGSADAWACPDAPVPTTGSASVSGRVDAVGAGGIFVSVCGAVSAVDPTGGFDVEVPLAASTRDCDVYAWRQDSPDHQNVSKLVTVQLIDGATPRVMLTLDEPEAWTPSFERLSSDLPGVDEHLVIDATPTEHDLDQELPFLAEATRHWRVVGLAGTPVAELSDDEIRGRLAEETLVVDLARWDDGTAHVERLSIPVAVGSASWAWLSTSEHDDITAVLDDDPLDERL